MRSSSSEMLAEDVPDASDSDEERAHEEGEIVVDQDIGDAAYDDERLYADAGSIGS